MTYSLESIQRLRRDVKTAATTLTDSEARFLVDAYYMMQDQRIRAGNQKSALAKTGEPHDIILWLWEQNRLLENQVKGVLDVYSMSKPVGVWSRSIIGIGPIIAAGLLAHIDITRAPTVGHIWRYAGVANDEWLGREKAEKIADEIMADSKKVDQRHLQMFEARFNRRLPAAIKVKGKSASVSLQGATRSTFAAAMARRPWNAGLKVLVWKIGESFKKFSTNPKDVYGRVYLKRKEEETKKNENGDYEKQAKAILGKKSFKRDTDAKKAYHAGKLPLGHIQARAQRYAAKLFLAHWHEVAYKAKFGIDPPLPYPIAHLGHAHKIEVPTPAAV